MYLMKNALKTLAKSVMIPLGLIAVAVGTGINKKKILRLGWQH